MQNKLVIAVRQSHPLLAEYQYKVSGKLSNGKIFTAPLTEQTGGDAALTIDYIPKTLHSQSFIRFHLSDNRYNHNPADFLNLSTGKVEPERTSRMQGMSLGFIGSDARYYKPTLWNKQHQAVRFAMHSKILSSPVKHVNKNSRKLGLDATTISSLPPSTTSQVLYDRTI